MYLDVYLIVSNQGTEPMQYLLSQCFQVLRSRLGLYPFVDNHLGEFAPALPKK